MEVRRITVRLPPELHKRLSALARERSVSLNTLVIQALEDYAESEAAGQGRLPLERLSALLAPVAEAGHLSEEELLDQAREVRRRIWRERYEQAVHSVSEQGKNS